MTNTTHAANIYVNNNYPAILNVLLSAKLVKFFFLTGLTIGAIKKNRLYILHILSKGHVTTLFLTKKDLAVGNVPFAVCKDGNFRIGL